jgi:hypothetical protein
MIERPHGTTRSAKSLSLGVIDELIVQLTKQFGNWKVRNFSVDRPCFDLVDIQQHVEHTRHGAQCLIQSRHQLPRLIGFDVF